MPLSHSIPQSSFWLPLPFGLTLFDIFMLCHAVVHAKFELTFWSGGDIFRKYDQGKTPEEKLKVARKVYFTKASWMILTLWLLYWDVPFRIAASASFLVYAIELVFLFPLKTYIVLNVLLAVGCCIEQWVLMKY
jgi:hypothetical protein